MLNPIYNLNFLDLYQTEGLKKIDDEFLQFLAGKQSKLAENLINLRQNSQFLAKQEKTTFLIETSKILEEFLVKLFQIEEENQKLQKEHRDLALIYLVKRDFVQRFIAKKYSTADVAEVAITELRAKHKAADNTTSDITKVELELAREADFLTKKTNLSSDEEKRLELVTQYAIWALFSSVGQEFHQNGSLFNLPKKTDFERLFPFVTKEENDLKIHQCASKLKARQDFNLTDQGANLNQVLGEAHYCIFCHKQDKDSCSTGLREKGSADFKIDELGLKLEGCPLEQKISEMNLLKSQGFSLAALAIAAIDNPLIAGTGHRICNDCMKSCIYQKQDPVNIPQIETRILKDVLNLPFGFEIYSLLTRWNPLSVEFPLPKENSGKKVLIAGLGPAGYTLAHYLLNSGHLVVAIDGLKIEPLDAEISGIDAFGKRCEFLPIKDINELYENLEERPIYGFGGVSEYGITARWDKNFLKIIRLLLERRQNFQMFGGIRFGSAIDDKTAFEKYGFDHVALCIGAGAPKIIDLKNNYAKGVRVASDFLMALQFGGAYKKDLFTNLQIRMPILVIGGGLTATDTATEARIYYLTQIEKFAKRWAVLIEKFGEDAILMRLNEEEKIIAEEFLRHSLELEKARKNGAGINELLEKWGGVKILYRQKIQNSPSYRLNHQELEKALDEGVEFIENAIPTTVILNEYGHIEQLKILNNQQKEVSLQCKTLLIAAGTAPNISIVTEDGLDLQLDGKYYQMIDENEQKITADYGVKSINTSILTKVVGDKAISFFGDLHPNFEGNVVRAMASAKRGYGQINELLRKQRLQSTSFAEFLLGINQEFLVVVKEVNKLSDYVFEIVIQAPILTKKTQIGQIFRLQNYQYFAKEIAGQKMVMEGVAVTALKIDQEKSLITGVIVDTGGSTSLIKNLQPNEPVIFMGPSGKPTEIVNNQAVMLVGGGRGNMPLAMIATEFKKAGCQVIFFAGYKNSQFVVRQEELEECADLVVFAIEDESKLQLINERSQQFQGTVIEAILDYSKRQNSVIPLQKIDRILAIGNNELMAKLAQIRHQELRGILNPRHIGISSLNAPMQCMLKGVCAQCLQRRMNEKTGEMEYFYSCANQDQNMDLLDFEHLKWRCEQNSLLEKIGKMWISELR